MSSLDRLIENNRQWADEMKARDQAFFEKLIKQQTPEFLWIGCADSRVPANEIVGMMPGELFVHRNVANLVLHTDINCLAVMQYAVDVLKVKHILIVGHYACGGVRAAMDDYQHGMIDNWLRNIRDLYVRNRDEIQSIANEQARVDRLCELNVIQQVSNVTHSTIVQNAWARGQSLDVHGWIYSVADGLIKDLDVTVSNIDQVEEAYRMAPAQLQRITY
jgi:carbonic anhydrase